MRLPSRLCPVCNKPRGQGNHSKCSLVTQKKHAADKRPQKVAKTKNLVWLGDYISAQEKV